MVKKEIEKYRKILLEKKREIVQHLSEFKNESKSIETGIAKDLGDKAESSYTKEFLLSLSDFEREHLSLTDEALKRIERGDFGLCLLCQKEIVKKRLDVIPWAPHCIKCQEEKERDSA